MSSEFGKYLLATLFILWVLAMFAILNRILPQSIDHFLQVLP